MTPRVVIDATVLVPALLGLDEDGLAAVRSIAGADLVAPSLLPFEVANVVRRLEHRGAVGPASARAAVAALTDLRWESWPFDALSERMWRLRANLTAYDAAYVALAEQLELPLVTFDRRIARAPGLRCEVVVPA